MDENKVKNRFVGYGYEQKPKRSKQARDWCFTVNNPYNLNKEIFGVFANGVRFAVVRYFNVNALPKRERNTIQGYLVHCTPKWFLLLKNCLSKRR